MASSVFGFEVYSVRGYPKGSRMTTADRERSGVNGIDIQWLGTRGTSFVLEVKHDFVSAGAMKAGYLSFLALCGTIGTVAIDSGSTFSNLKMEDVVLKEYFKSAVTVGGYNAATGQERWIATFEITLKDVT